MIANLKNQIISSRTLQIMQMSNIPICMCVGHDCGSHRYILGAERVGNVRDDEEPRRIEDSARGGG